MLSLIKKINNNPWIQFLLVLGGLWALLVLTTQLLEWFYDRAVTKDQIAFTGAVVDRYSRVIPHADLIIRKKQNSTDGFTGPSGDFGEFKILLPKDYYPTIFLTIKKDNRIIFYQVWDIQPGESIPTNYP